ncbi:MAG: 50S ribosomal protein L6 [bacterium]
MSRIGKKPIAIPKDVSVRVSDGMVSAKGPKGDLVTKLPPSIKAEVKDASIVVSTVEDTARGRSFHGLARSLIANMILGVEKGFTIELELQGVGFRAAVQGNKLTMNIGYSSPVVHEAPKGITIVVKDSGITVGGPDKQLVGDVAARIRSYYPPEPYKGKGIRYKGEHVRRKAGKTVA